VWRPSRIPDHWAPLGTVATDYPPSLISPHPEPPPTEPPPTEPPPTGRPHPGPPEDRRSRPTRQAHALSIIINKFLELGCAPTQGGERPHLLVTVTEQSLRDRTRSGTLGYGDHLPIHHIRMLACDARIIPAVLGGHNETLDMGRASRTFNAACRRAILTRDIGCVFPGCPTPGQWAEYHHIHHWADGGPSDYNNAALLCRRHTLIHHNQWQLRLAPDGQPEIIPPTTHDPRPTTHDPTQHPQRNTLHKPPQFNPPNTNEHS